MDKQKEGQDFYKEKCRKFLFDVNSLAVVLK